MSHKPRKRFGQNFLEDQGIIDAIVTGIAPKPDDHIVEIGPGQGALTHEVAPMVRQFTAIEIDRDLIAMLTKNFSDHASFTLLNEDALRVDLRALKGDKPLRVIGNLPYNISTPLLFHFFSQIDVIEDMHFMLQKEVVERLCAPIGDADYGRLSVMCQYYCQANNILFVPPESFYPPPKVDSAVVRLTPRPATVIANDTNKLEEIVKMAFNFRRKTLRNTLKKHLDLDKVESLGIDLSKRPQELSVEEYVCIANSMTGAK